MWAGKNVNLERSNTSQSRQLSFQKRLTLSSPLLCYRLCLEPWGEWAGALLAVWRGALGAAGGMLPKECFLLESQGERNWSLSRRSWIQLSNFSWHRESRKKQLKIRCVCLFFVVCFFFSPVCFLEDWFSVFILVKKNFREIPQSPTSPIWRLSNGIQCGQRRKMCREMGLTEERKTVYFNSF